MARPRKEGMDYFPHDNDASSDEKIEAMRALFGNDGYAFYFILCERVYRTSHAELDVSKRVLLAPIVTKLLVTEDKFNEMLDASFELNLFDRSEYENRGVITSNGIKRRFGEVQSMRERWRNKKDNPNNDGVFSGENKGSKREENPEETGESKAKQIKELYIAQFELFWDLYPNKKGKAPAQKKFVGYGDSIQIDEVLEGTKRYIQYCKATERPFKDGSTFVNQQSWNDDWTIPTSKITPFERKSETAYDRTAHLMELQKRGEQLNEPSPRYGS